MKTTNHTPAESKESVSDTSDLPAKTDRPGQSTELGNSLLAIESQERVQQGLLRAEQERLAAQGRPESFD